MSDFRWTERAVETLRSMWETHSRAVIANELGCSRNAVIGKGLRIGLPKTKNGGGIPKRDTARRVRSDAGKERAPRVKPSGLSRFFPPRKESKPLVDRPIDAPASRKLSITELRSPTQTMLGTCKWPVGNPQDEDFHYCGADTDIVYCPHHARIAYQPGTKAADRRERDFASRSAGASRLNAAWS